MSFSVRPHINFLSAPGRNTWNTLPQWNKIPDTYCGHPYVPNYCTPYALALSLPEVGVQCELIKSKCLQVSTSTFSKPSFAPIFWCRYFTSDFFPSKPFLAHPSSSDFSIIWVDIYPELYPSQNWSSETYFLQLIWASKFFPFYQLLFIYPLPMILTPTGHSPVTVFLQDPK